jgi:hypothetical protein
MKYRDLLKQKVWSNHKRKKLSDSVMNKKLWFLKGDIRWSFFLNQWIRSGKRYVMNRVVKKSQEVIRTEYLCSPWLIYRSALWGSRLLLDIKTKKFGRKQVSFPVVVRGTTVFSRPMLYFRKLFNSQKLQGLFWSRWNNCVVSSSLGHGPLFATLENKYIQLAKLQNIWVKRSDFVDYGKGEWTDRFSI